MTKKLMFIALISMLMTAGSYAQTNLSAADLKVTIPFQFHAGDRSLPSGVYTVRTDLSQKSIILRSDKVEGVIVLANSLESLNTPVEGVLKFSRYGSDYFLQEVWVGGRGQGQQIRSGKLQRELASKKQPVEMVMVQPHSR